MDLTAKTIGLRDALLRRGFSKEVVQYVDISDMGNGLILVGIREDAPHSPEINRLAALLDHCANIVNGNLASGSLNDGGAMGKKPIYNIYCSIDNPPEIVYEFVPLFGRVLQVPSIGYIPLGVVLACDDNGDTIMLQPEPGLSEDICLAVERAMAKIKRRPGFPPVKVLPRHAEAHGTQC